MTSLLNQSHVLVGARDTRLQYAEKEERQREIFRSLVGLYRSGTYTGPVKTWANEMTFIMSHAPGAGSIAQPVDQQSSALPLYHRRPHQKDKAPTTE